MISDPAYSTALGRVQIVDAFEPSNSPLDGFLNPQTISYALDVDIGELNPVGWSSSVLQYGHTKSGTVPIELYFSTQLSPRVGAEFKDLYYYTDFFMSFCYPDEMGSAPHPLLIVWPKVMELILVVKSFQAEFMRFNSTLESSATKISMETRELRIHFRDRHDVGFDGIRAPDHQHNRPAGTGQPVKLGKK